MLAQVWLIIIVKSLVVVIHIDQSCYVRIKNSSFSLKKTRGKNWKSVSYGVVVTNGRVVIVVLGPTLVPVRFEEVQEGVATVEGPP